MPFSENSTKFITLPPRDKRFRRKVNEAVRARDAPADSLAKPEAAAARSLKQNNLRLAEYNNFLRGIALRVRVQRLRERESARER